MIAVTLTDARLASGNPLRQPVTLPTVSPLSYLPHGLCQFDEDNRLVIANSQFQRMYGLPDEAVQYGTHSENLLASIERADIRSLLAEVIQARAGFAGGGRVWTASDGRAIAVSCETIAGSGYATLHEDVTRLHVEQSRLSRLAFEDSLTGLLNRSAFNAEFSRRLESLDCNQEFALLCLDLDHFKQVNDTLGHPTGDQVLQLVAKRLTQTIRPVDVVARLGGDEFAILQVGCSQPAGSKALAKRIIDSLSQPFIINDQEIHIGVSVGVAIPPYDGDSADELLKNADLALFGAKADGRGLLRYFEPEMDARMQDRRSLEIELRRAVANAEFEMHYQPILDIVSDRIVCFEALVRWNHPTLGCVSPDKFIPLAEETGLIVPLGEWVLRRSCQDASTWGDDTRVAVNLSSIQLRDRMLIKTVLSALQVSGLPASRLELEVTETSLMSDTDLTIGLLHQLRSLGVRIAMDDFGTGYSSISYLRRFPFDKIKIDRSFISGADRDSDAESLVRMIASLGTCLGVKTTAEGVETCAEMQSARDAGCTEIQGYLLSKPIRANAVASLLQTRKTEKAAANLGHK